MIERLLNDLRDMPYKVKWFIQRGSRGWADCDWWNMDSYLVSIIIPMLKRFRADIHGYPCGLTEKKWDSLLGEMIEGFEAAKRVIDDEYYKEVSGDSVEAIKNASKDEIKQWGAMNMADQKLFAKKGRIFIKHFFGLWD